MWLLWGRGRYPSYHLRAGQWDGPTPHGGCWPHATSGGIKRHVCRACGRFSWDFILNFKACSYFLKMRMRSECWRHKFATNNSQQLKCVQLLQIIPSEKRTVTSKFASHLLEVNRALSYWEIRFVFQSFPLTRRFSNRSALCKMKMALPFQRWNSRPGEADPSFHLSNRFLCCLFLAYVIFG